MVAASPGLIVACPPGLLGRGPASVSLHGGRAGPIVTTPAGALLMAASYAGTARMTLERSLLRSGRDAWLGVLAQLAETHRRSCIIARLAPDSAFAGLSSSGVLCGLLLKLRPSQVAVLIHAQVGPAQHHLALRSSAAWQPRGPSTELTCCPRGAPGQQESAGIPQPWTSLRDQTMTCLQAHGVRP
jgi:hypothetical protein